ncbi:hypothetical protein LJC47_02325 [Desulfosarcina sp. OttesenSCG-928-B08]|nr:hypothetical protein [Desulfosarcina sp. OttesenSCG-928-B08]
MKINNALRLVFVHINWRFTPKRRKIKQFDDIGRNIMENKIGSQIRLCKKMADRQIVGWASSRSDIKASGKVGVGLFHYKRKTGIFKRKPGCGQG